MYRWWPVLLTMLFVSGCLLSGQAAQQSSATDPQAAIKALLHGQVEAWNRADLKGFMNGYWNSPDLIFASGTEETRGWENVYDRYRMKYQTGHQEMGKLSFTYFDGVHVMSPDFAYVDGEYQLTTSTGKQSSGVFTLLLRHLPEGWRIVHDRTCPK